MLRLYLLFLFVALISGNASSETTCIRKKSPPPGSFSIYYLEMLMLRIWLTEWAGRTMDAPEFRLTGPLCDNLDTESESIWVSQCTPVQVNKHGENYVKITVLNNIDYNNLMTETKRVASTHKLSKYKFDEIEFQKLMDDYRSYFLADLRYTTSIDRKYYGETYPHLEDTTAELHAGCETHLLQQIFESDLTIQENETQIEMFYKVGSDFFSLR